MRRQACFVLGFLFCISLFADDNRFSERMFRCTGAFQSPTCEALLFFNQCQNKISFSWRPLLWPGTKDWASKHRNYCSIEWDGRKVVDERKFPPERCEEIVKIFEEAFSDFPEFPEFTSETKKRWSVKDPCAAFSGTPQNPLYFPDGILMTPSLRARTLILPPPPPPPPAPNPDEEKTVADAKEKTDPNAKKKVKEKPPVRYDVGYSGVFLEELTKCQFFDQKNRPIHHPTVPVYRYGQREFRVVRCPVLPEHVHRWLAKFLSKIDAHLLIKNPYE